MCLPHTDYAESLLLLPRQLLEAEFILLPVISNPTTADISGPRRNIIHNDRTSGIEDLILRIIERLSQRLIDTSMERIDVVSLCHRLGDINSQMQIVRFRVQTHIGSPQMLRNPLNSLRILTHGALGDTLRDDLRGEKMKATAVFCIAS